MRKVILLCLLLCAGLQVFALSGGDELFKKALEGDASFEDAAAAYAQEAAVRRDSGVLFYNLGNALSLAAEKVPALTAYAEALRLKPGDGDFRSNRTILLHEMGLEEPVRSAAGYIFWFPVFLAGLKGLWMLILLLLSSAAVLAFIGVLGKKSVLRTASLVALVLSVFLTASALTWESRSAKAAFVIHDETRLYRGDSPLYDTAAILAAGTEVILLEEREGWCLVKTAGSESAREGWLKRNGIMNLEDLFETLR